MCKWQTIFTKNAPFLKKIAVLQQRIIFVARRSKVARLFLKKQAKE